MAKNQKRFITTYQQGAIETATVIVDKQTGVNYLFVHQGYAGGLTVLLDKEGKPVITPVKDEE